jgi:putative FmdB family regulatory protein
MPTYVYECKECKKVLEIEQRITEDPLKDCQCGASGSLRRLIQPVGVMFKGSGFYVNDATSTASAPAAAEPKAEAACSGEPASCPACTTAEATA